MMDLKEMLEKGNIVVISYVSKRKTETGVVKSQEERIETRDGVHYIDAYDEYLNNNIISSTIIKIYKLNEDNELELIWDRERDFIDWSTISVDTKVLVRDFEHEEWQKRYFCKYEDDVIYCWSGGCTSFSAKNENDIISWGDVKLYKEDKNIK